MVGNTKKINPSATNFIQILGDDRTAHVGNRFHETPKVSDVHDLFYEQGSISKGNLIMTIS